MKIADAINKAKENKRNFKQSVDLIINFKNLDLKKPENKIKINVVLPNKIEKERKIGFFADNLIPAAQKIKDIALIKKDEIEQIGRNKKKTKAYANECYAFLAEAQLMPLIGKTWGQILAVRGKMPKPIPSTVPNLEILIENARSIFEIGMKNNPVIQCRIGTEDMSDDDIEKNIDVILKAVEGALPKGKSQIKNIMVKTTMGKPVKVEIK